MKLKWFHCSHEQYDGIGKLDVFILVDSTEHLFLSLEIAKPFGSTNFFPCKCQYGSEFSQIGTPHFSLEGVNCDLDIWVAYLTQYIAKN